MALVVDFSNNISIRDQIHIYMSSCRGIARRGPIFNPSEHLREINVLSTDYRAAEVGVTVARHFYKMDRPRRHMESHGNTMEKTWISGSFVSYSVHILGLRSSSSLGCGSDAGSISPRFSSVCFRISDIISLTMLILR